MDKRWIAGFVDGEGSFVISVSKGKNRGRNPYLKFGINVAINLRGEDMWVLQAIQKELGGKCYQIQGGLVHWQTTSHADAERVCRALYPHLILKKNNCAALLKALKLWIKNRDQLKMNYRVRGYHTRTKEDILKMLELSQSINQGRRKRGKRTAGQLALLRKFVEKYYK